MSKHCDTCEWTMAVIAIHRAALAVTEVGDTERLAELCSEIDLLEEELAIHRRTHGVLFWMREPWIELVPVMQIGVN